MKEDKKQGMFTQLKKDVRKRILTGLLLILPVYVTFVVIKFLFGFIGGILSPVVKKTLYFLGVSMPNTSLAEFIVTFFGLILTFIALYFLGIFAANFVGKSIIKYFENLLTKTPVVKSIYSSVKQVLHAVALPGKQSFKRVVLVDFPKEGTKSIGFVTGAVECGNGKKITVFIPTIPNPTTGFLIFVDESDVTDTNLTVEDAFKTLFSAGVLIPESISAAFKTNITPSSNTEIS
ncbi:MAG TPA: DUF502 domain-containing protein [Candidatus Brocadiaceae bacterium]|nr:DUF502 domain-containing protein [Candidatus Brocadiaceae bacterium]